MRGKKVLAVMLCAAMVSTNTGMISMASVNDTGEQLVAMSQKEESSETGQKSNYFKSMGRLASPSEPEKPATPSEPEKPTTLSEPDEPATPSEATYVSTEEQLRKAVGHDGEIVLESEISLTEPLKISGNISIEGKKIIFAGNRENCDWEYMLFISKDSNVTLKDITIDATGMDCNKKQNNDLPRDYYAVWCAENTQVVIKDGTNLISNDKDKEPKNSWKRGMLIKGSCSMEGGVISGFVDMGIYVTGEFIMTGGELTQNGEGTASDNWNGTGALSIGGKNAERKGGYAHLAGGTITGNSKGVFNGGTFEMTDGEITENQWGVMSNNHDGTTKEEFYPDSTFTGGTIENNKSGAIWNKIRGKITIAGTAEINGQLKNESQFRSMVARAENQFTAVIRNEKESILNIDGGTVTAYAPNETAIFNDSTSKLTMTGGEIIAAGENTVAIQNTNTKAGDVVIARGTLTTTGAGSKLLDNQGYIDLNEEKEKLGGDASGKYLILASHNEGGNVTPSYILAEEDQKVELIITPDEGYRISMVMIDDNKADNAVSLLKLQVTGNHKIEVTFEKKQSSGSNSSGGSSSGSSRTSVVSSTKIIPETPGSWIQDQTGWKFINGAAPYSNIWIRKNNAWYWMGEDGYMKTGWNLISEKWYYLMPVSGEMKTGWIADGVNWYYADETGARVTGWVKSGEKWYYLNADGKMAFNTTTPDGYQVDESGVWIQ